MTLTCLRGYSDPNTNATTFAAKTESALESATVLTHWVTNSHGFLSGVSGLKTHARITINDKYSKGLIKYVIMVMFEEF